MCTLVQSWPTEAETVCMKQKQMKSYSQGGIQVTYDDDDADDDYVDNMHFILLIS